MKKILLLTALMAGAMTVNAQSDFQVKELAKLPVKNITNYDKGVCRSGYGFGDKFYMTDRNAQQLRVFNLATGEEIGQKEIGANQALGHDEAGNAIIANWGFAGSNPLGSETTFTLISADLAKMVTTEKVGSIQGRGDFLGKAKGNVFGAEGATLLASGAAQDLENKGIVCYTFSSTGDDTPSVQYSNVYDGDQKIGVGTWATYNYYKDVDGTDRYLYVNRQVALTDIFFEEGEVAGDLTREYNPADRLCNKGVCNGGEIFVLGSRKFIVYGNWREGVNTYLDGFTIAEIGADNKTLTTVYTKEPDTSMAREMTTQGNWLNVEVLSDKQAKLYQYFLGGYAAEYGITIDGADMPTGIAGVENAAAKAVSTTYYTPAGVASKTAVKGLNIVVTKYADGSQKVVKVIK
ncbi:MAG: hypothetical protein MR592_05675 [Prevotella sp.]|nr:hypothetical protein [Prevotella sp.]